MMTNLIRDIKEIEYYERKTFIKKSVKDKKKTL